MTIRDPVSSRAMGEVRDSQGRTPLHLSAVRGDDERMRELIEAGADVSALDHRGNTPLHYCGHSDTTQCLVDFKADLFIRLYYNNTIYFIR